MKAKILVVDDEPDALELIEYDSPRQYRLPSLYCW